MAKSLPPPAVMLNLSIGHWVARLVHVAAKLRLADLLKGGPRTAEDLAAATGVQAPALYRVLRALASVGVFAETTGRRFKLTPIAATLQTGVPASMHGWTLMINEKYHWDAWEELLYGVKTGEMPFLKAHGVDHDLVFSNDLAGYRKCAKRRYPFPAASRVRCPVN